MNYKKLLIACIVTLCTFPSCKEDLDIKNASNKVLLAPNLGVPIIDADISIGDLLSNYKGNNDDITIGKNDANIVTIFYKDTFVYSYKEAISCRLDTFGIMKQKFYITDQADDDKIMIEGITAVKTPLPSSYQNDIIINRTYNFNEMNDNPSEQRVDSIQFFDAEVNVKIKSSVSFGDGVLKVYVNVPNEDFKNLDAINVTGYEVEKTLYHQNFTVKTENGQMTTNIPFRIVIKGDDKTELALNDYFDVEVKFNANNAKFIAYGYFNYKDFLKKEENIDFSLYDYLPKDCLLKVASPIVRTKVKSEIGAPLEVVLTKIKTKDINNVAKEKSYTNFVKEIGQAPSYGEVIEKELILDNTPNNGNLDEFFDTKLNQVTFDYYVRTKNTPTDTKMFIASDSKVELDVQVEVPAHLKNGSQLTYSDTIFNVGNDIKDIIDNEYISSAVLRINASNSLPVDAQLIVTLIDENNLPIEVKNYKLKAGQIGTNYEVTNATNQLIHLFYNEKTLPNLRSMQHIVLTVKCTFDTEEIKIKYDQGVKAKIGVYTNAGVSF